MEIENLEDFATLIKKYRYEHRLSQIELEGITGVPQPRISLIERGVQVGFENYKKILTNLKMTLKIKQDDRKTKNCKPKKVRGLEIKNE